MTLIIDGDKIFFRLFKEDKGDNAMVPGIKGTFKVDPSKKPKAFDITTSKREGDDGGQKILGIYELDGNELRIVYDFGTRPKGFKGSADFKTAVLAFKRK